MVNARSVLDDLAMVAAEQRRLAVWRVDLIDRARSKGVTWARIGSELGVTAQGAQQEHRRARPLLPL